MKHILSTGLLITSASFSLSAIAYTSADTQTATEIPAVLVSGARTEQSTLTTPASITVISRQQINASGASHVVDVLRGQGGVQITDLYGDGSRATVDMRGFGDAASSNTMILVDGRRLNNPDIGSPDLNSVALDDVERIEIVQGSAGVLFGDQAVGGVINIITRKPGMLKHLLKLSVGSYNAVSVHGATSQALANGVNYRVSLDARESDNYRDNNELSYLNGFGKLGYDYSSGSVFAELQYIDNDLNTPGALFGSEVAADRKQVNQSFASDYSNAQTTVGRIGLVQELSKNWSFEGEVTNRKTDGDFRISFAGAPPSNDNYTQNRKIREFTPRFIGVIPAWNNTLLTIGADAVDSEYELSTIFGDQFNDQAQRSLYMQAIIPANNVDITLGVRHASVDNALRDAGAFAIYPTGVQIDDDVTVGTLGLAIKADEDWRVLLRADQNYRFAKVDEFLQPVYTPAFTPVELKTQEGLSLEAGMEWSRGGNAAKVILYNLKLENEIVFDPANYGNINLDKTRRQGFITSAYWKSTEHLGFSASYTYTDAEVTGGFANGKNIPLVAEHSALLSTDYKITESWQGFVEVIAVSSRVLGGDFDNSLSKLPGYGLLNIKAEYVVGDFTFSSRVNNLLDKAYADVGQVGYDPNASYSPGEAYYPSPEINFLLTAAWNFR